MQYPSFFFFLNDGKIFGYHLAEQAYYEIDSNTFAQLLDLSGGTAQDLTSELDELNNLFNNFPYASSAWQGDIASHIAHSASRLLTSNTIKLSPEEFVTQYTEVSKKGDQVPSREYPQGGDVIELPTADLKRFDHTPLSDCFKNRKTCREFKGGSIPLQDISDILYSCFGPIHGSENKELEHLKLEDYGLRRSSPSSTGLASCDAFLWADDVEGLKNGLYAYHESNHTLIKLQNTITTDEMVYGMMDQFWLQNLSAGIFIVNDLRRNWVKDMCARGYIAGHQEAGHLSQNVLLTATALGLQTWLSGSFRDDFLQDKLSLAPYRFVSLFVGLGRGSNAAVGEHYLSLLNKI